MALAAALAAASLAVVQQCSRAASAVRRCRCSVLDHLVIQMQICQSGIPHALGFALTIQMQISQSEIHHALGHECQIRISIQIAQREIHHSWTAGWPDQTPQVAAAALGVAAQAGEAAVAMASVSVCVFSVLALARRLLPHCLD